MLRLLAYLYMGIGLRSSVQSTRLTFQLTCVRAVAVTCETKGLDGLHVYMYVHQPRAMCNFLVALQEVLT
jgi:hypothetical protein